MTLWWSLQRWDIQEEERFGREGNDVNWEVLSVSCLRDLPGNHCILDSVSHENVCPEVL